MATDQQLAWLKSMVEPAQLSMKQWRVPASITLAQCILESDWGASELSRECHNYFGVKAVPGQPCRTFPTREVVNGASVMIQAAFADYADAETSFYRHACLLATLARYAPAMRNAGSPVAFAQQLQACGYSTSPTYAASLVELIREHNLTQYDTNLPPAQTAAATGKKAA